MSMNDGGPAFPVSREIEIAHLDDGWGSVGMTLRDYFAAKAMQGFLAEAANPRYGATAEPPNASQWAEFAEDAYCLADAMIAARTHQEPQA